MKTLFTFILVSMPLYVTAFERFTYIGSYDNVTSETGEHCYGTDVMLWRGDNSEVVGLFSQHAGLCGDPSCSIVRGSIKDNSLSFVASKSIYGALYSFQGAVTKDVLTGELNTINTTLKANGAGSQYKDKISWCSAWVSVKRCKGVQGYCQ